MTIEAWNIVLNAVVAVVLVVYGHQGVRLS
jgi:hypothetical protein